MTAPLGEAEVDIKSELVDLGEVPLVRLRTLDGEEFDRALRRVIEQTSGPRQANKGQCSQLGID